jgi:hypothetical protein
MTMFVEAGRSAGWQLRAIGFWKLCDDVCGSRLAVVISAGCVGDLLSGKFRASSSGCSLGCVTIFVDRGWLLRSAQGALEIC